MSAVGGRDVDEDVGRVEQHDEVLGEVGHGVHPQLVLREQHRAGLGHPEHRSDDGDIDVGEVLGLGHRGEVAVAYLAQHLLVLLDPADILVNIQAAYRRPDFGRAAYAVLHTGPSATADIEGVLIHGAQGVRSLTVILLARNRATA